MPRLAIRARWVVPVASPAFENGHVVTQDEYILAVGHGQPETADETLDVGDAAILPGLINAHTHLALTSLRGRVPFQGSFVGWIKSLGAAVRAELATDEAFIASVQSGLTASLAAGVTTVADIGYGERGIRAWNDAAMRVHGFLEVLGMGPKRWGRHEQSVDVALRQIEMAQRECCSTRLGLSPHGPYSTDAIVYKNAVRASVPLCTHAAETREELQLLRDGSGPFRELLEELGLWDGSFAAPGCSPIAYLKQLRVLDADRFCPTLLAHANYVSDEDLDLLAESSASVVYCPRTHAFFRHEPHRWRDMLARRINVCLGTDSLASNATLSILDELRFLHRSAPDLPPESLLKLATQNAARALGQELSIGMLGPGFHADVVAVPLTGAAPTDPAEDVLAGDHEPSLVMSSGRIVRRPAHT